ncbi:hypothetical protein J2R80_000544 [Bradyrhizobium sp. USDA 4541]|nr:hypothetical protein [Bradyrhizobium sp. USDA 4541]MCP1846721.1 hypothetical protein [Bradyrhizobium sp. USDA 4541]
MADAILQHRDARPRPAQPLQPGRARFRVLRLGRQQHPVDRRSRCRIGEGAQRHFHRAFRPLDREPIERPPDTGDHVMLVDRAQQAGDDAADAAETDDGDGLAVGWSCHCVTPGFAEWVALGWKVRPLMWLSAAANEAADPPSSQRIIT